MKQKVVTYVTRATPAGHELLVFDHRDFSNAGTQVPADTVEPSEAPEDAVLRELFEESGLRNATLVRELGNAALPSLAVCRHYYQLLAPPGLPATWSWTTNDFHDDAHRARNEPLVFCFRWVPLMPTLSLAGRQDQFIEALAVALCAKVNDATS